jgi:hypothetical protein
VDVTEPSDFDGMAPIKRHGGNVLVAGWAWRVITVLGFAGLVGLGYQINEKQNTIIDELAKSSERVTKLESQWDFVLKAQSAGTIKNSEDIADVMNDARDVMSAINGVRQEVQQASVEQAIESKLLRSEISNVQKDVAVMKSRMMNGQQDMP